MNFKITKMERLRQKIRKLGEKLPKKHGDWFRLKIYDDNYLVLDTWNKQIAHYKGCVPSDTNNMYNVVYVFTGFVSGVEPNMANFWSAHIKPISSN